MCSCLCGEGWGIDPSSGSLGSSQLLGQRGAGPRFVPFSGRGRPGSRSLARQVRQESTARPAACLRGRSELGALTTYLVHRAGPLLAGGALVQGLHMAPEALGLLDFCQQLIHLPAAVDLGVVRAISHPAVTWLPAVGKDRQPRESLRRSGRLFKADVINPGPCAGQSLRKSVFHLYSIGLQCF